MKADHLMRAPNTCTHDTVQKYYTGVGGKSNIYSQCDSFALTEKRENYFKRCIVANPANLYLRWQPHILCWWSSINFSPFSESYSNLKVFAIFNSCAPLALWKYSFISEDQWPCENTERRSMIAARCKGFRGFFWFFKRLPKRWENLESFNRIFTSFCRSLKT